MDIGYWMLDGWMVGWWEGGKEGRREGGKEGRRELPGPVSSTHGLIPNHHDNLRTCTK
jgi:hypothetical protein